MEGDSFLTVDPYVGSAAVEGEKDDSSPSVTWRSGVGDLLPQNDVRPTGGLNVIGGKS